MVEIFKFINSDFENMRQNTHRLSQNQSSTNINLFEFKAQIIQETCH